MTDLRTNAFTPAVAGLPSADLFVAAPPEVGSSEIISRPTLTYWQDAIGRLRKDKMAMTCVGFITLIVGIGLFVPLFFPDPVNGVPYYNSQNSNAIDQGPTFGEKLLVVDDMGAAPEDITDPSYDTAAALADAATLTPPADLKINGMASVSGVSLTWTAVPHVSGYQVYRTTVGPNFSIEELKSGSVERGILVAEITNPAQISYNDAMGLDASESYAYSVLSYVTNTQTIENVPSKEASVITTPLIKTIALTEAQQIHPSAQVGQEIHGRSHLFGTDGLGRDVLARMIMGTRVDMLLALLVPFVSILVGLVYGSISGLLGKKTDVVMMRIVEVADNFPDILFFILLQVAIGKGLFSLFVAMTLFWWAGFARIVRGEVLRLREIEFVQASRLLGASLIRIVQRHVAPNLLGIVIIAWSARIPSVIAFETFLSMLGLGIEQPNPSWGNVVFDSARRLQVNPIQFFLPATVLGLTLLAFYLLGNSLRDAFDPNLRGRG